MVLDVAVDSNKTHIRSSRLRQYSRTRIANGFAGFLFACL